MNLLIDKSAARRRRRRRRRRSVDRYEKADDPAARVERLVAAAEKRLRESFLRTIARIRDEATFGRLVPLLEAGRIEEAVALGTAAYEDFAQDWIEVYAVSATQTAGMIGRELRVIATFDQVNFRAVEAMRANQFRLVRELSQDQLEAAREALLGGVEAGLNPRAQARAFRDSLGLTAKQERFVANYRRDLESGSARALSRQLRDGRFDGTVRRAIREGQVLEPGQISKMVGRYRQRWVKFRSEVIARTESLRSVHEGVEETYRQAIDSGHIDPDEFVRIWNTAADERVRDTHEVMNGQEQPLGTPFVAGSGVALRFPGDPAAPASETVQCRCVLSTRFTRPGGPPG